MTTTNQNDTSFAQFKLPPALLQALVQMNYTTPTPVQKQAIPPALNGRDVLGSAQTGTGKTGAFSIPTVARLLTDPNAAALILTPTRELASQITDVIHQLLGRDNTIRTALLVGGASMGKQLDQLRANPRLIVGTPGRINDHLRRNSRMFANVKLIVLDEADRMLDMGFVEQIDEILEHVEADKRQTLMFSATFPPSIIKFSQKYLNDPVRISINPENVTIKEIKQEIVHTTDATKYMDLTLQLDQRSGSIIVFVRTKHGADRLAHKLERENHDVDVIHGGLKQNRRDKAIAAFRNKKTRIMIATDVAARGLDVPHIEHVINYDLPQNAEDYVHRIGRTARAGAAGTAVSFLLPSDKGKWRAIDNLMNPGASRHHGSGDNNHSPRKGKPRRSKGGGGYARRKEGQGHFSRDRDRNEGEGKKRFSNDRSERKPRNDHNDRSDRNERSERNDKPRNLVRFSKDHDSDRFAKGDNRSNRDFQNGDFRDGARKGSGEGKRDGQKPRGNGFRPNGFKKRSGGDFKRGGFKKQGGAGRPPQRHENRRQKEA